MFFIYECQYDVRLKDKDEETTRLTYTVLCGGLEHLKIETRFIDERFESVMGECVIFDSKGVPSIFTVFRSASVLVRMFPISDLNCEEKTTHR